MSDEYIEKLKLAVKGKIAVYIDAANLERSVQEMFVRHDDIPQELKHLPANGLCWAVDYKKLKDFFGEIGDDAEFKFYCAEFLSASHKKFRYFLDKSCGFKMITKPLKEYNDHTIESPHRKANFDVEIAVDATFFMGDYDTFVLFSGDCDFEYLVKFLRGRGKIAIGFSRAGHIAKELPPVLSHYFDVANFRGIFLSVRQKKAKSPAPVGAGLRS